MIESNTDIFFPEEVRRFRELVEQARRVTITCHVSPDGDAVGSTLALRSLLMAMGKYARVVTPDMPPKSLSFLPGAQSIIYGSSAPDVAAEHFATADLIVCLDFNDPKRVDRLEPMLLGAKAPKVLIDHHLMPMDFADVTISSPQRSSTCLLLHRVIEQAGWGSMVNADAANCLLAGMMTDTGAFTYNANSPELYRSVASLVESGADHDALYKRIFDTAGESRLRICGYGLYKKMVLVKEYKLAVITLTDSELLEFGYQRGDTESLVNKPLAMEDILWSVFLRQDEPEFVKVSMRSKDDFPVNEVCETLFNGGGHKNAAGGEYYGSLEGALNTLLNSLPRFADYLSKSNQHDK